MKPNKSKAANTTIKEDTRDYVDLKGMVQQLTHQLTELTQQQQPQQQPQQQSHYYRGNNFRGNRGNNRGKGGKWYNGQLGQQQQNDTKNYPILCRRCGQDVHIQKGRHVRMDHTRQDYYSSKPMPTRGQHNT